MPGSLDVGEKWDTHVRDPGEKITEGLSLSPMLFDTDSK